MFLTTGEAAKFLKVAPRTVMKWCDSDRLKHVRQDGTNNRLISPSDLSRFMEHWNMIVPEELLAMCRSETA